MRFLRKYRALGLHLVEPLFINTQRYLPWAIFMAPSVNHCVSFCLLQSKLILSNFLFLVFWKTVTHFSFLNTEYTLIPKIFGSSNHINTTLTSYWGKPELLKLFHENSDNAHYIALQCDYFSYSRVCVQAHLYIQAFLVTHLGRMLCIECVCPPPNSYVEFLIP